MMSTGRSLRTGAAVLTAIGLVSTVGPQVAVAETDDTTPPAAFDLVADAGDYQTGYVVASPWTSVSVSWNLTTDDTSTVTYEILVDGVLQRVVDANDDYDTMSKRVDVPDGAHDIAVVAVDDSGNRRPANQTLDVFVDKVSPTFTSFPLLLLRRGQVSMDAIPVRYTWTATDVGTGLSQVRIGYGPTCCTLVDVDSTHHDFTVPAYSDRNWRVFLYDGVGRTERVTRQVAITPLPNAQMEAKGSWSKRKLKGAVDNDERVSSKPGDRMVFRVAGRSVSWVTTKGPKRGVAEVLVDGRLRATIDLRADTLRPSQAVWAYKLPLGGSHRIEIVNRSPKARSTVGVDAILVQA
jgi:hypothetical protein